MRKNTLLFILCTFIMCRTVAQSRLPCLQQSPYFSDWQFIGPYNTPEQTADQHFGAVNAISVNPSNENEIFIGAYSAGLFHTLNRGKTWACLTDTFIYPVIGVNDIWIDYSKHPYTILLATGSKTVCDGADFGILKSTDGGKRWEMKFKEDSTFFVSNIIKKIRKDPNHPVFYAYGYHIVLRSFNEGETWEQIFSTDQIPSVIAKRDYEIISFEISNDGTELYFTTQASYVAGHEADTPLMQCDLIRIKNCKGPREKIKYEKLTKEMTDYYSPKQAHQSFAVKVVKTDRNILFIDRTYLGTFEHSIYGYDIQTHQFISVVSPNNNSLREDIFWQTGLIVDPKNSRNMYMAGNILYKSTDDGQTFRPLYGYGFGADNIPHADIRSTQIFFSGDGEKDKIYLGTDGGLSYSGNSGTSFINLNGESLPITQFYGLGVSPFTGTVSAGSQDNSIMSYLPAGNKWVIAITGDGYDVEYSKTVPQEAYGQYNARLLMKTKNDIAPFTSGMYMNAKERASNKKTLATTRSGNVYFAEDNFNVLRKGKKKWDVTPFDDMHQILSFAVSKSDTNIIYMSKFWHSLYKSADGGKTFENISEKVKIDDQVKSNTRIHAICISPYDADKVWISTGYLSDYKDACRPTNRVLYSSDGGNTWTDYSEGLPVYSISDLVFLEGTAEALFASTLEGVFFRENSREAWKLFSANLPKCVIPEMQISYCTGKLIAATYGRGMWQTELPNVRYDVPLMLSGDNVWEAGENEALYFTQDIELKKNATLTISAPVHMARNKRILVKNLDQVKYGSQGKLLNACGVSWGGIQVKK